MTSALPQPGAASPGHALRWLRILLIPTLLVVAGVLECADVVWQQANEKRAIIERAIPVRPDLDRFPVELSDRLSSAEQRVRHNFNAPVACAELASLYHANGFFEEARQCYQALLRTDPDNPRWPHRLAGLYASDGELDVAIPLWQRTIALDRKYGPAGVKLGDALFKANRPVEATDAYVSVLKGDPSNPYALTGLGRLDLRAGQFAHAREHLEQAAEKTGFAIGGDLLATAYEQLGDQEHAVAVRARAKSSGAYFDPPDPWTDEIYDDCYDTFRLTVVAGVAEHSGDINTSGRLLLRALEFSPDDGHVLLQLGMMYLRTEDYASARRYLERARAAAPQLSDVWAQLIVLYSRLDDPGAVEQALSSGLIHCPNSPGLRLEHARHLAAAGDIADAVTEYRESFRFRPDEAAPLVEIANLYLKLERVDEAVAELRHALKVEPEHPTALATLALFAIGTGDEAAARSWLRRVDLQIRIPRPNLAKLRDSYSERFGHVPSY